MTAAPAQSLRAAEFFAGIGLVRRALELADIRVVFANDIDPVKMAVYKANFPGEEFKLCDIAHLTADDIPDVDLATASFPCTDVSLAGNRAGLHGPESGTFWHFASLLHGMRERRPRTILLENVSGLGSSKDGSDLHAAIRRLNELGYSCDVLEVDARWWVPQSRKRVFVIGSWDIRAERVAAGLLDPWRPAWVQRFLSRHPELLIHAASMPSPTRHAPALASVVERLDPGDVRWWDRERVNAFVASLAPIQALRLKQLRASRRLTWRTAYRRTRAGKPVWEIRTDEISGCLRTARGGSSRQALVEAGRGRVRMRWMTVKEYAALMGAGQHRLDTVTENQALFGLGDAVCVPAVAWLLRSYVAPIARDGVIGSEIALGDGAPRAMEESLCLAM
jgi:DNA (cytosine-5)-methyltransferase 1